MGSDAMIYVPSFIKTGSDIQKWIRGIHIQTHRHTDSKVILKPTFIYFFKQGLKMTYKCFKIKFMEWPVVECKIHSGCELVP
jgi:hypothetical protein